MTVCNKGAHISKNKKSQMLTTPRYFGGRTPE